MSSNTKNIVQSFLVMIVSYMVIWFLKLGLLIFGSKISGLDGDIIIDKLMIGVVSKDWNTYQVLTVYLLPFLILMLLTFIISRRFYYPIRISKILVLTKSWIFIFLMIEAFVLPVVSIIVKSDIYYPLTWLGLSRIEQYLFALILFLFYLSGINKSGPFFAAAFENTNVEITNKSVIVNQILTLILLPALGLVLFILFFYGFTPSVKISTFIITMVISIGIAIKQIYGYNVIIR